LRSTILPLLLALGSTSIRPLQQQDVAARVALSEPAFSPDAREIAFIAGGDIWTVPAEGGIARLLVAHPATESRPVYSPDGRQLAFVSSRTGNGDIYVLDIASGRVQRRTFDDTREQLDAWSHDGAWIYFSSSAGDIAGMNDVWRVSATGGQPGMVAADRYASEYWAAPSPDGKTLAITARGTVSGQWWRNGHSHLDESELWLVRSLESESPVYERFGDAGGGKDAWPMWSVDGKSLYYMSDRSGNENLWVKTIGGAPRQLTRFTSGRVLWPQVAKDGSNIVFEREYGVWRYDVARNSATQVPITLRGTITDVPAERQVLTQGFQSLALAPDGRKVAFIARGDVFVAASRDAGDAFRVTRTPELESDPVWLPDSRRIVYASNRANGWHLYLYDVAAGTERALTSGAGRDIGPRISPDGRLVAYQRNGREVRVVGIDGQGDRKIADGVFDEPPLSSAQDVTWSPDSRLIAYTSNGTRGYLNAWIASLDGAAPKQVSFLADANGGNIVWSPDGTFLLYVTGQRTESPRIVRVDLVPRTPRFREDQFRDLFAPTQPQRDSARPPVDSARRDSARISPSSTAPARGARRPVTVDYDDIRLRASIVPTQGFEPGAIAISPDGRTLLMSASAGQQQQLYTLSLDELSRDPAAPRALTTTTGGKGSIQWSPDSREVWFTEGGRIVAMPVESRQPRPLAVNAEVEIDFDAEKRAIFQQAWSYLATNFYDEKMHGADWAAVARNVEPYVAGSRNPDDLRRVLSLMVGELNASHLGVSGPAAASVVVPVGHIGVRFDRTALEQGRYRVREVITLSPADIAGIRVGDVITAVEGVTLGRTMSLDSLMLGRLNRRVSMTVTPASGAAARVVAVRPGSIGNEKGLAYRQWVEQRRAYVAKISNGRLGYVHMFDMGQGSLDQLHLDLDAENQTKDGVVIDVRNNNGGFVNPYAIDVFARRGYLQFTNRGAITSPARANLGQRTLEKPTVLVTNQHSLSDAEDFTEGYRALGLGKVVGEPTSGWIIFTWNVQLLDGTTLRLPRTRVTDAQGKDMELNPRAVDVNVVRPIGEAYSGSDAQLDAAVRTLLEGIRR
jgi:Tol biopolymer transport system component/C-terminal processing protease CtpA/Prc